MPRGEKMAADTNMHVLVVDDFATMSDETRAYLIKKYRNGVP